MSIIAKDTLVRIAVKMYDLQGNLLEETDPEGMTYLHGHEDIFAGIEKALEGKKEGDKVTVQLEPEEAFGEFDEEAIFVCPVEKLGDPELVVPGLVYHGVPGQCSDDRNFRVTEVADGMAIMDGNHPFAGYALKFDVTVLEVKTVDVNEEPATGNDTVVVPGFLGFAEKIIDDEFDDDTDLADVMSKSQPKHHC